LTCKTEKYNPKMTKGQLSVKGLYSPDNEHDNCGIGFVTHIKGKASHDIIEKGFEVLRNLDHRGAKGADDASGDGAGILMQIPHEFIREVLNIRVSDKEEYGTGLIFLPKAEKEADECLRILSDTIKAEGLTLLAYRDVPVNSSVIGDIARTTEPQIKQVFVKAALEQDEMEQKLYIIRKLSEKKVRASEIALKDDFYIVSLSSQTIVYKGMFTPEQLRNYYPDLQHPRFKSAIALVHSRFSTNTFPTWALAQPFRLMAHNGEINTIKGNRMWAHAREALLESDIFGEDLKKVLPVLEEGKSDSASFDNVLEFLYMTGRSLDHALCMMIP